MFFKNRKISYMSNKKTILVVEDETTLRKVLSDKFRIEGFDVLEARNGEEGLSVALDKKPDLIILDNKMPKMDGVTMIKKLRPENSWSKKVPIILLTNLSMDNENTNPENEASYYLVKSNWSIKDLLEKVKELF